jgi:hypothetical protein
MSHVFWRPIHVFNYSSMFFNYPSMFFDCPSMFFDYPSMFFDYPSMFNYSSMFSTTPPCFNYSSMFFNYPSMFLTTPPCFSTTRQCFSTTPPCFSTTSIHLVSSDLITRSRCLLHGTHQAVLINHLLGTVSTCICFRIHLVYETPFYCLHCTLRNRHGQHWLPPGFPLQSHSQVTLDIKWTGWFAMMTLSPPAQKCIREDGIQQLPQPTMPPKNKTRHQ